MNKMPTSVRTLREIVAKRQLRLEDAGNSVVYCQQRLDEAKAELERAEQGIAPPGFYLVDAP